ncbi:MAG: GDP-mannose 4,6-dehydratase [Thermomicrobiales bacterium]
MVTRLSGTGPSLQGISRTWTGSTETSSSSREGDLRNEKGICAERCAVELVYHQGALASVPRSIADPQTTFAVNVTGTLNLLVAARSRRGATAGLRVVFVDVCPVTVSQA